jgi:exopolyphosphatase/guanosine-5'-triphosphate,3'-diphosphate pyrophosphatase
LIFPPEPIAVTVLRFFVLLLIASFISSQLASGTWFLSKRKEGKPLPLDLLRDYYKELSNVSLQDRMRVYKLKEDRADVIVPALKIYLSVMRWAGATEIYVPKIGLADGLIQHLWVQETQNRK